MSTALCGRGIVVGVFSGLSAFPLTPFTSGGPDDGGEPDLDAFSRLIAGLVAAGVDSVGALGSTGGYPYLPRPHRRDLARVAVRAAGSCPVIVGVGALTTREILEHVADAEDAGAAGILVPPLGYQRLRPAEVVSLYRTVTGETYLPVVVYDNPVTTGYTFTREVLTEVAALPRVVSVKIPPVTADPDRSHEQLADLREAVSRYVSLGISGDRVGAQGLLGGCDTWYSVLAGVFPRTCKAITVAAQEGDRERALELSAELNPVWDLFDSYGSYRAVSAIAAEIGLVRPEGLHHPVLPLSGVERDEVRTALEAVGTRD